MDVLTMPRPVEPLDRQSIEACLKACPRLPSLGSISQALRELLDADQRYASQISDVIRRDPSLTARLLRLVNSVYYGITTPVKSIEEAVFYLGVRQIRQLAMVTPVIEDFQRLVGSTSFPWREFWRHCIGTALLTGEVISSTHAVSEEADYVAGLVHDVGKIVMAAAFPDHFSEVRRRMGNGLEDLLDVEAAVLGLSHPQLGAIYLRCHNLPPMMVAAVEWHHQPEGAAHHTQVTAAVQIADLLVRHAKIGNSGNPAKVPPEAWLNATGWQILYPARTQADKGIAQANLRWYLERLPAILEGLV